MSELGIVKFYKVVTSKKLVELIRLACKKNKEELGFLALTSKVENPIRDRVAWELHSKSDPKKGTVTREWNRTDIAILKSGNPKQIIEFKAGYLFDWDKYDRKAKVTSGSNGNYIRDIEKDLRKKKNISYSKEGAELFLALLLVDLECLPQPEDEKLHAIKYRDYIRKFIDGNLPNRRQNIDNCLKTVGEKLKKVQPPKTLSGVGSKIEMESLSIGSPFGCPTILHVWAIGPFHCNPRKS